jgi:cyanate lyase
VADDELGLTFADLAEATGRDEVYIAAVCYGSAKPSLEVLGKLNDKLDFAKDALATPGAGLGKEFFPVRGSAHCYVYTE